MTMIQAYRRVKNHDVDLPGAKLKFRANEQDHFVCDVANPDHVEVLLNIPTAFRLYGEPAEQPVSAIFALTQTNPVPPQAPEQDPDQEIEPIGEFPNQKALDDLPAGDSPYLLIDPEGGEYDLRPLDDAALRAFAAANGVTVHHKAKGDTIRDKIVEFFRQAE